MPAPNFFVVGAPKAGTTSLCKYLEQHPAIFISPIKEPCFFAPEVADFSEETRARVAEGAFVLEWDKYLELFRDVRDETAIGEGSVSYLGSMVAPGAIRARIPAARIIVMLRDPVDRLFSHYVGARVTRSTSAEFVEWVGQQRDIEMTRQPRWGAFWTGRYAIHIRRYLDVFPAGQIQILLYDDYVRSPDAVYRALLEFLGVDPSFPLDSRRRHNVTLVPRWPVMTERWITPLTRAVSAWLPEPVVRQARMHLLMSRAPGPRVEERQKIIDLCAADIQALQALIGRDLSEWLDPRRSAVA